MFKEKEIIDKVINLLKSSFEDQENFAIIPFCEYTEDRESFMVVIGVDNVTQVNQRTRRLSVWLKCNSWYTNSRWS